MKTRHWLWIALLSTVVASATFGQGTLTPPAGPPSPSMKSLQEIWDKIVSLSKAQEYTTNAFASASAAGGKGTATISIAAGQTIKLESVVVTTYNDPSPTAYLRFLVKETFSTSRIMVQNIPLVATGNDPVPNIRSGVLQLPMWIHGGTVSDVELGHVHSLTINVQSSASATATCSCVLNGYYANP